MQQRPVLVLGGGRHQVNLIRYIKDCGYPVVLADFLEDSPGHKIANVSSYTSTLDISSNLELARKYDVQGVITSGTDQPLVVMAEVAHHLGLPCYLTPKAAKTCTDKKRMFPALAQAGANIPNYCLVGQEDNLSEKTKYLDFPLIVKPSDSQGQRGITVVQDQMELSNSVENARQESSSDQIILQEFVSGPEITISAWVTRGNSQIMLITDRVTYNRAPATGVCLQHIYPSQSIHGLETQASELVQQVATKFDIAEGPLYVQCVCKGNTLYLIEATCRIGGGHEELLIEMVTGVEIRKYLLSLALNGQSNDFPTLVNYPIPNRYALVNFILARPGKFDSLEAPLITPEAPFGNFYYGRGYIQKPVANSMGRVGYFVCRDISRDRLLNRAAIIYKEFNALDSEGNNLVFWPNKKYLNT